MPWYAVEALDDALDATRALLTPLDAGQWLRLALVVFFLGSVGGGSSVGTGGSTGGPSAAPAVGEPFRPDGPAGPADGPGSTDDTVFPGDGPVFPPDAQPGELLAEIPDDVLVLAAAAVGVALLLGLAYALVGSVMEFVFVESLRRQRVRVRGYADQHLGQAVRLFGFRLALGLLVAVPALAGVLAVLSIVAGSPAVSVGLLLVLVPLFVMLGIAVAAVDAFTTSFVVPVMIRTNLGVLGAWRRFWPTLTGEWRQYGAYALIRIVLALAVGLLASVVGGAVGAVVAAPLVVLAVVALPAVGGPAGLLADPVALTLAALVVLAYVVVVTATMAVAFVPVRTYVRYHALLVLGDTEPEFDLIPDLRREIRDRG